MSLHFTRFKYGSKQLGSLPAQYDNRDFVPQRPQGLAQPTGDNTSLKHGAFPFSAVFRDAHCRSQLLGQRAVYADQIWSSAKSGLMPVSNSRQ